MSIINYSSRNLKFCLELDRIRYLLDILENPEKNFRIIHIAGTNGKGSVCSFIETGLISMGKKCGLFISPELLKSEDSIRVNGIAIKSDKLNEQLEYLMPYIKIVEEKLGKAPSGFEILFAAALLYFKSENCHTVILECGMGGIGDATNAICRNDISVFSPIGIDHCEYLGDTIDKIAVNKCGIIRENTDVISIEQPKPAQDIISHTCIEKNCRLHFVKKFKILRMDGLNAVIKPRTNEERLSLAGCHQSENAAVAVAVLDFLGAEDKDIVKALTSTVHKARLEEIMPGVYFDGAHNPAGVRALTESINTLDTKDKICFAVGFMADKDIQGCFNELKNLKNKNIEIFTARVYSNPRSESSENLRDIAVKSGYNATACDNINSAIEMAKCKGNPVFVFGSLYMYKEIMGEK